MCIYIYIYVCAQKGTPWECGFSLHSATTDTAHVPWFFHCFATIDNFCVGFLQWLNKTKIKKNKKTRNQRNKKKNKMTRPNPLPLLLGVCNLVFFVFFVFCFFGFLVFWFLVFWFVVGFSAMAKQNQNQKQTKKNKKPKKQKNDKTQLSAITPPLGCAILFCFFCFLCFWFLGFLVSCFLVRCWFFEGLRT